LKLYGSSNFNSFFDFTQTKHLVRPPDPLCLQTQGRIESNAGLVLDQREGTP